MYPNGYLGLSIGHKNGLFVTIGPPDNDVDLKTKPPPERPGGGVLMLDVIPLGFEPKTHSLEGCCSIQLSYGTKTPL